MEAQLPGESASHDVVSYTPPSPFTSRFLAWWLSAALALSKLQAAKFRSALSHSCLGKSPRNLDKGRYQYSLGGPATAGPEEFSCVVGWNIEAGGVRELIGWRHMASSPLCLIWLLSLASVICGHSFIPGSGQVCQ